MLKRGFTLIELLIVVAIIAILAAIAVPNFLEAQTRSKVSRAKADLRSLATAIESYVVDNNTAFQSANHRQGPWPAGGGVNSHGFPFNVTFENGTPIDCKIGNSLTADTPDHKHLRWALRTLTNWMPITTPLSYMTSIPYDAFTQGMPLEYEASAATLGKTKYSMMYAMGPDKAIDDAQHFPLYVYDPTNGTLSNGDMLRICAIRDSNAAKAQFGANFDFQAH